MKSKIIGLILVIVLSVSFTIPVLADGGYADITYWDADTLEPLKGLFQHNAPGEVVVERPDGTVFTMHGTWYEGQGQQTTCFSVQTYYVDENGNPVDYVNQPGKYTVKSCPVPTGYELAGIYEYSYTDGPQRDTPAFTISEEEFEGGYGLQFCIFIRKAGTAPASDTPSSWAVDQVNAAILEGLVPENLQKNYTTPVSRGSVAQMFINLIEKSSGQSIDAFMDAKGVTMNDGAFTDTSDKAVLAANALGIINGIGDNKFDPNGTFTRAQIAAIINRVARVLGVETEGYSHSFTDVAGHWVNTELGWPVHAGIINGTGNNKFDPDGKLTTEQAIAISYRAFNALK